MHRTASGLWYGCADRGRVPIAPRPGGPVNRRFVAQLAFACAMVMVVAALVGTPSASAHPELERSVPAADGLVAAPPRQLELWFTERIDIGAGSPLVELIDESGERYQTDARVDDNDPSLVIAEIDPLDSGTWTVAWQVRSLDDGHTLTGSFAFRVGGANRAPGAATTAGEWPRAWNVVTRWSTFVGAAMAAGAAALSLLSAGTRFGQGPVVIPGRIRMAALAGIAVAAVATVAEPWLLTRFPPANSQALSLGDAIDVQPSAWLMRLIALAIGVLAASIAVVSKRLEAPYLVAGGAALIGLLGLSMTGHAAARESVRELAIAVDALHQWSIALWFGMLVVIVLSWRGSGKELLDRFSGAAMPLVIVGVAAGVANSAFILPKLSDLWESTYGRIIIAKLVGLAGVLTLAWLNRSILMRAAESAADLVRSLKIPMRAELLLAVAIVAGGSLLSLISPPAVPPASAMTSLAITNFSAPAPRDERMLITLHLDPAEPGPNDIGISLSDLDGNPVPNDAVQRVFLDFSSLISQTTQAGVEALPGDDGIWRSTGLQLSIADWWRVTAHVRRAGVDDAIANFYVVLPDPNMTSFPETIEGGSDPAAEAVFHQARDNLIRLHRVSYSQQLATGSEGQVVLSFASVNDGFDGSTPAQTISTEQTTAITIGTTRWLSQTSSDRWGATQSNPPIPPSEWGSDYDNAVGFRVGGIEDVHGEPAQIVTFYTPQSNLAPAFLAWWVSVETGQLLKVAMVSRVHYMTQHFTNFDGEIVILPPVNDAGTPVATPGLDISNLGG